MSGDVSSGNFDATSRTFFSLCILVYSRLGLGHHLRITPLRCLAGADMSNDVCRGKLFLALGALSLSVYLAACACFLVFFQVEFAETGEITTVTFKYGFFSHRPVVCIVARLHI